MVSCSKYERYSAIEHLARSLWLESFKWSNRMAMYSAYFDESGHPDRGKILVVAGGLASVEQWAHLEREWKDLLKPFGTALFHAVDFERRNPPFDRITKPEARELRERLAGVICRRSEKLFSSAVNLDHYRVVDAKWVFAECYGFPYPMASRSCIGGVEAWANKHSIPVKEILLFFEDGAKHNGQLAWMAERDGFRLPIFQKKADVIALQVGDFIAWHQARILNRSDGDGGSASIIQQLEQTSHSWRTMDLEDADRFPSVLGIPRRDSEFCYRSRILKKHGVRRALLHYWRKDQPSDQKIDRNALVLPNRKSMSPVEIECALAEYDAKKRAMIGA